MFGSGIINWSSFANLDLEQAVALLEKACGECNISYNKVSFSLNSFTKFMLGSKRDAIRLILETTPPLRFEILDATADPMSRVVLLLFSSDELKQTSRGVCVFKVSPINKSTKETVSKIMLALVNKSATKPWEFGRHIRFSSSPFLRWKIKKQWLSLIKNTTRS